MIRILWVAALAVGMAGVADAASFSFGRPVRLTLERNNAANVAIGDADGDGREDLAETADLGGPHQFSLFLQRGGALSPPLTLALPWAAQHPYPVAFVDLDGDGADEVVVGKVDYGMSVIRLEGDSLSLVDHPARRGCDFLAIADVDGDGHPDVLCHDWKLSATLFYGDGRGGIRSSLEILTPAGTYSHDFKTVRLADVTGDGRPDLLITASAVSSFFVMPNNGFGGFWPATAYPHPYSAVGVWPAALEVLDLDADGVPELVTASPENQPNSALNVYRRDAGGYYALSGRAPLYDSPTAMITGDADGDGVADLVAGHFGFNSATLLTTGHGDFSSVTRFDMPGFGNSMHEDARQGRSNGLAMGDLDGDGCTDLAGATYSGVQILPGCQPFTNRLPLSDFDGDGVSDVVWRLDATNEHMLWQWVELGAWYACVAEFLPIAQCPPRSIIPPWVAQTVGDFDGDGNSDMFLRNRGSGANQIWDLAFYPRDVAAVTNQDWQVVGAGDFDGDDRSDLLWRNARTGANTIWRSADVAASQATTGVTDPLWQVAGIGDFDGDRRSDILWRHARTGRNAIWRSGRIDQSQAVTAVTNVQWRVAGVCDFDGDGRDDLVWRNGVTGANAIWRSASSAAPRAVTGVTNMAWNIAAVGDYNGDAHCDLLWHNNGTGASVIWLDADYRRPKAVATFDTPVSVVR